MSVEINATNFPDAVFRQYVSDNYDTNQDGTLSDAEITAAINLTLIGSGSSDFWSGESVTGIEYLTALEKIRIKTDKIASFDSRTFSFLEELDFSGSTGIVSLNIGNPNLQKINCNGCSELRSMPYWGLYNCPRLQEIDFGGCSNLEGEIQYFGKERYLTKLNVTGCEKITQLVVRRSYESYDYSTGLTELDLTGCHSLRFVDCSYNSIGSIIFDSGTYSNLENINCTGNDLYALNLPDAPKFKKIYLALNHISTLSIEDYPQLIRAVNEGYVNKVRSFDSSGQEPYEFLSYVLPVSMVSESGETIYNESRIQTDLNTVLLTNTSTVIVTNPRSVTARVGDDVSFSVEANGSNLSYQWMAYDPDDGVWEPIQDENTNTFSLVATAALDGTQYVCRVSNESSTVESAPATLTVILPPTITSHPQSATVTEGQTVLFSVVADGNDVRYQWQSSSNNGSTWADISGAVSANYSVRTTLSMNGNKYRCRATNAVGDVVSNAATLTVEEDTRITPPTITTHPTSQSVNDGDTVMFTVAASGTNLSYQWQVIQDGTTHTWVPISGATGTTYSISATSALNGKKYRCAVTNEAGTVYSNAATLTVTAQPSPTPTPTPTPSRITNATRVIINGVDITRFIRFQGLKWSRNDVDGPNAGRNMIGDMIRDRVATKIRIDISCRPLTSDEHQMLMNLIMPEFVTVMYNDPVYGFTSKTMYANNNNSEYCICKSDGREYWHNVTFPLIEK